MTDDADETSQADDALPASMADMFFALVAIVIFLLLALVPAIGPERQEPAVTSDPDAFWRSDIRIEGRDPTILIADGAGLRIAGPPFRHVGLSGILDDAPLARLIKEAQGTDRPVLLVIEPAGQEGAFAFEGLASSLGLTDLYQLRISEDCRHVLEPRLQGLCRRGAVRASAVP